MVKRFAKHIGIGTPFLFEYIAQGVGFGFANDACTLVLLQVPKDFCIARIGRNVHYFKGGFGGWLFCGGIAFFLAADTLLVF